MVESPFALYVQKPYVFGSIAELDVSVFEESIAATLPTMYRRFLLETNGGPPSYEHRDVVRDLTDEPVCDIQLYFELSSQCPGYASLPKVVEDVGERLPKECIPIATDSLGNLMIVDLSAGSSYGTVSFWEHDAYPPEHASSASEQLADSFADFLDMTSTWSPPGDPAWLAAIKSNDTDSVVRMVEEGININARFMGRSMIEHAAIHARTEVVKELAARGASMGDALRLAEQN